MREAPEVVSRKAGLVLAVSDFDERRPALPEVRAEANWLGESLNSGSRSLLDANARREALLSLAGDRGLDRFAFWHIASHAYHDPNTGRLGGIALADGDLWLDQIAELAPLPRLVTLSVCSGMQSRLYEGDEPVGLAATCLAAGAQQMVGSLWPVHDASAVQLMKDFYSHWWSGKPVSHALALAQRAAARVHGMNLNGWGSFLCIGA